MHVLLVKLVKIVSHAREMPLPPPKCSPFALRIILREPSWIVQKVSCTVLTLSSSSLRRIAQKKDLRKVVRSKTLGRSASTRLPPSGSSLSQFSDSVADYLTSTIISPAPLHFRLFRRQRNLSGGTSARRHSVRSFLKPLHWPLNLDHRPAL